MCVAVPRRIASRDERGGMPVALVEFGAARQEASLVCVPEARVGDWVLVHLGMALQVLDEQEAAQMLALLAEAGLLDADGVAAPAGP